MTVTRTLFDALFHDRADDKCGGVAQCGAADGYCSCWHWAKDRADDPCVIEHHATEKETPMTTLTPTFEPLRPLAAPDGPAAYAAPRLFGGWLVHYGEAHWPTRVPAPAPHPELLPE